MSSLQTWKRRAKELKREAHALCLACRDPRTPWVAKLLAVGVVAYALSPIDLVPDFIPVLGQLDDLVIVPLGVLLVRRVIPAHILEECRREAEQRMVRGGRVGRVAAVLIVTGWLLLAGLTLYVFGPWFVSHL